MDDIEISIDISAFQNEVNMQETTAYNYHGAAVAIYAKVKKMPFHSTYAKD